MNWDCDISQITFIKDKWRSTPMPGKTERWRPIVACGGSKNEVTSDFCLAPFSLKASYIKRGIILVINIKDGG